MEMSSSPSPPVLSSGNTDANKPRAHLPTHDDCVRSPEKTDERNVRYLVLLFSHSVQHIQKTYDAFGRNYAATYDKLVGMNGHGTPGATPRPTPQSPVPSLNISEGSRLVAKSGKENPLTGINRANEVLGGWQYQLDRTPVPDTEYWNKYWGDTYTGFKEAQKELGSLRDAVTKGEFAQKDSKHSLDHVKVTLNTMLLMSVREWYKKWGELDLHRLSSKEAAKLVRDFIVQVPWKEMRIVAGQRQHLGNDHHSEGVLYGLLHRMFDDKDYGHVGRRAEYETDLDLRVNECRKYVRDNKVQVQFYSRDAAVLLKKERTSPGFRSERN